MDPTTARMNRRELIGLGALALGAAACGGSTGGGGAAPASSQSLSAKDLEGQLKFYNWAQYVNPTNTKAYTDTTGVKFEEANFTSNEQLLTKLQTTKGQKTYDIIVPDADHVRIEKDLGLLMKLDTASSRTSRTWHRTGHRSSTTRATSTRWSRTRGSRASRSAPTP